MLELIAQVATGNVPESVSFKQAEWGHLNEPLARDAFRRARAIRPRGSVSSVLYIALKALTVANILRSLSVSRSAARSMRWGRENCRDNKPRSAGHNCRHQDGGVKT